MRRYSSVLERCVWRTSKEGCDWCANRQRWRNEFGLRRHALALYIIAQRIVRLGINQYITCGRPHNPVFRHTGLRIGFAFDLSILLGVRWRKHLDQQRWHAVD